MGGKFHLKLNIGTRPIANKYREGKMKSTLKRELKGRETVKREAIEVSSATVVIRGRRNSNERKPNRGSSRLCTIGGCVSASVLLSGWGFGR